MAARMQMTGIISEREGKITRSLYTMGMMRSAYWASWIAWEATFSFFITWVTIAFGAAIQLDFFLENSVGLTFFALFLFQLAMLGFAFLLSSCIRKSTVAIILSFVIFIIGWIFQVRGCMCTAQAAVPLPVMSSRPSVILHAYS